MPNWLKKRALLTPNRQAIIYKGETITFTQLYQAAYEMAGKLTSKGVKNKQFTAVLLQNHLDSAVILLALQLLGVRAVILNNRLTADELIWQIRDSNSVFLLSEERFLEKLSNISDSLPDLPIFKKEELAETPIEGPLIIDEIELDDICTIMYTSGTTGYPKGVIQTYGNHWWSATGSALNLGLHENDCWLCTVPLFHISGYSILMKSIIYGMKIVLHERFDVNETLNDIRKEQVTIMSVVSTTLTMILDYLQEERLPKSFRCMLLGGGPASLPLLERCVKKDIPVFQTYGMTETSSQIVTLSPEDSFRKLGSAGKPLFPSQLKIMQDGREAMANEPGEIVVKGPNVTPGYLNREKDNRKDFQDGWLHTGDIGYVDEDDFLFVLDRRSDLIISGGENIYPAEIEGVLTSHSAIKDAGVIGRQDDKWGEIPVAFLVKKAPVSETDIMDFCKEKLAKYKIPKKIYFIDEIPRNASKKILRRELRKLINE
ncbi:o-succinylbenzoate--CoA ligase [Niallia endozanthoxylica]|uniref:2-succinylbenzoate--CoA ligase n=1 Tax=Niallia endozanthoxylica TaxID=2036016 RepID=A0A5J5GZB0_9BACI|nr:o-succinylbenzoate--CoA ligase [Niallia endozanthoxylica]KAA9012714.1 o-succinylbenzoate--CoA ligase [Niallia endozanthoxylica]